MAKTGFDYTVIFTRRGHAPQVARIRVGTVAEMEELSAAQEAFLPRFERLPVAWKRVAEVFAHPGLRQRVIAGELLTQTEIRRDLATSQGGKDMNNTKKPAVAKKSTCAEKVLLRPPSKSGLELVQTTLDLHIPLYPENVLRLVEVGQQPDNWVSNRL